MLSTTSRSVVGILMCALALAFSVKSSALPADAYNRQRDTTCTTQYGLIQIIDPSNPGAIPVYLDNGVSSHDGQSGIFFPTSNVADPSSATQLAGVFAYQNCEGYVVAELKCVNTPSNVYNKLGLSGPKPGEAWIEYYNLATVNHIGGSGPSFFPSDEPEPMWPSSAAGTYQSESAVWTLLSNGFLIAQLTLADNTFKTVELFANGNDGLLYLPADHPAAFNMPRTLQFVQQFPPVGICGVGGQLIAGCSADWGCEFYPAMNGVGYCPIESD